MSDDRSRSAVADETWGAVLTFFFGRRQLFVDVAAEFELTPGDMQAIMSLDPDDPRPMKALAASFRCDPSNATWMVDRLEQRGLVERRSHPSDRRVRTVAVTDEGRVLRASIMTRLSTVPPEFDQLTDHELDTLRCAILKLARAGGD